MAGEGSDIIPGQPADPVASWRLEQRSQGKTRVEWALSAHCVLCSAYDTKPLTQQLISCVKISEHGSALCLGLCPLQLPRAQCPDSKARRVGPVGSEAPAWRLGRESCSAYWGCCRKMSLCRKKLGVCTLLCVYESMHVCVHKSMYVCEYMCECMNMWMCVHV